MITKFVDFGVLTKISKASEELMSPLHTPGEARKDHDNLRVYHWAEIFYLSVEPNAIYSS